jgi:RHS repeat-associated protein
MSASLNANHSLRKFRHARSQRAFRRPRTRTKYTYDAAGNVLTYATVTATYNNRGRMKTLKKGTPTETLIYNALGQMVKTSGGALGTELFMYDEAGHLIGEYSSTGTLIEETIWLGDIPVATLRPNGSTGCTSAICIFYVHSDHLNTPRRVSRGSDNKLLWSWLSDPFGTTAANESPAAVGTFKYNLRFPGQIADSQAGLSQNYFRDYDPAKGGYIESDPIGLRGGINTYGYVAGNPISDVDPRGLEILVCSRKAKGLFFQSISANHGYLWDTRNNKSCGAHGSSGKGKANPKELGRAGGDECNPVPGSAGVEDKIMSCCNSAGDEYCIEKSGLRDPGAPGGRLGPPTDRPLPPLLLPPNWFPG